MNDAAVDVQVSVWTYVFISLGYIPRSRIDGSYSNSVYLFEILPDYFSKTATSIHISPRSVQRFQFFSILTDAYVLTS